MPAHFCVTVRFLQPLSHGRGDDDEPEWPPSPLRLFQALVAASAARWNERKELRRALPALRWLEMQPPPLIIAAPAERSPVKYRLYVPDNVGDKVGGSWARGGSASIADYRTEKNVRSAHLTSDAVHFLYPIGDDDRVSAEHRQTLSAATRSITHLGWGIDMVAASASVISEDEATGLSGERWQPEVDSANTRRAPLAGTVHALMERHGAFLNRIATDGFRPVPSLSAFRLVGYRRTTEAMTRPFVAFSILRMDTDVFRAFDTVNQSRRVAGMMRGIASSVARSTGWSEEAINTFILGHGESREETKHQPVGPRRFAFLPLPSIEVRGAGKQAVVGSIRRVIVTTFGDGCESQVDWARLAMSNQALTDEGSKEPVAVLSLTGETERAIRNYTRRSSRWATVTPVVLPGYDDPAHYRRRLNDKIDGQEKIRLLTALNDRIDRLLRKAIVQSGFSATLAEHVEIEWRKVGFWPGTDLAGRYRVADYLRRFTRYHVRLRWRDARGGAVDVPGPICLGGGRFCGMGLFAAEE